MTVIRFRRDGQSHREADAEGQRRGEATLCGKRGSSRAKHRADAFAFSDDDPNALPDQRLKARIYQVFPKNRLCPRCFFKEMTHGNERIPL